MPQDLTDDKSTLAQVMAWCRQATSLYLNQCWPRSPTPYGITRPQWVNTWRLRQNAIGSELQIMPWHLQVKSHYLNQLWSSSLTHVCVPWPQWVCSLSPDRCRCSLNLVIFKLMARIDIFNISCEIALRQMPQNRTDDKLTLVQLMAWYRQATSHYLSQCWPRSVMLYGITTSRPQWVNQTIMPQAHHLEYSLVTAININHKCSSTDKYCCSIK